MDKTYIVRLVTGHNARAAAEQFENFLNEHAETHDLWEYEWVNERTVSVVMRRIEVVQATEGYRPYDAQVAFYRDLTPDAKVTMRHEDEIVGGIVRGQAVHWVCATPEERGLTWARWIGSSDDDAQKPCARCGVSLSENPNPYKVGDECPDCGALMGVHGHAAEPCDPRTRTGAH